MALNHLDSLLQQSQDTVSAMLDDGLDAEQEFEIEHHLVSANFDLLEKAAVDLVKAGFHVDDAEEFETDEGETWFYFAAVTSAKLDDVVLAEQTRVVCEIANKIGVEYDGWGTYLGDEEE
ncbi:ribonuclease E inhibitor RraB [Aliidiomarina celeris]|uniref:ribonuclease E inhibitor RraB n=1 Tax=Aliidiomarina celeris TaxID=2249428 RepID=UPI000DE87077|nr:ribonuclease E inhibitor RraB [Aliidiomarina celeris]